MPVASAVVMRFQATPQSRTVTFVLIPVFLVKRFNLCSSFSCGDAPFGIIQTVRASCFLAAGLATGALAAKMDETAIAVIILVTLVIAFMIHLLNFQNIDCIIFV